ncbi:carbon starvation CstA family protein [Burkholderia ubonensis]|uniref:Carbon starvation protein A n=1 Tax=Burkholderia ubonensis TaxID=101571 RepID=A0A107EL72_9BURK|nr:carbon starvation CstA family protein [Burkholderia ubonensis]AOK62608.1 carbon starvation protein A [Burkholderia ubonensis]KVS40767.1 carbon starvation protein A [Burkholderia ubonensis]KVS51384.1 carbon starvation protein A [Burkholderia ubonensis]KVS76388.1 carbon starvation protein A [Burkholderia ubonensis]KVS78626.1 carbon starvation protein A [Burkholderia ubonensis]
MNRLASILLWGALSAVGAFALATVALRHGESVNAVWLVTAALIVYFIAYRFYSKFIAERVLRLDDTRQTPAERHNDGMDYVPTNRWVLFGHHFAAIAGAGPLVGPVLAAQMGYLPGALWILAGVVLGGAVQDFIVLFASVRRDGKSLGEMIKIELGPVPGSLALAGVLAIMIIILAVLALVVVKALTASPWGLFTIAATIPIALLMGLYMRVFRPGRVGEASILGAALLLAALFAGKAVASDPAWGPAFTLSGPQLAWALILYGAVASSLPVWLMLAPRDYLSTFLKIGTIVALAIGIYVVAPSLAMPQTTRFIDGSGPVFSGKLFPFLFITIACGAVSGFHSLISSGTTPKMIERESHMRFIGFGGMLAESFVAIMALVAACVLQPGIYFAMNAPAAVIGTTAAHAAQVISGWGFTITPEMISQTSANIGETTILSRAGGAPTLAVGMAQILAQAVGGSAMQAFWYHFAILFEALFILTAVDAGTRVGRFMIQDMLGHVYRPLGNTDLLPANLLGTGLCVALWGYFLYQGVVDPLGGINTLWQLFGVGNQMLAGIALLLCTSVLMKMKRERYVWVTLVPTAWLLITTLTAGLQKIFSSDPHIGFLALANRFSDAAARGTVLAPAKSIAEMHRVAFNNYLDAAVCGVFVVLVVAMCFFAIRMSLQALRAAQPTAHETPMVART